MKEKKSEKNQNIKDETMENKNTIINMQSLAKLVGFPTDFLKSELLLKNEDIPLEDLRRSALKYLVKSQASNLTN